MDTISHQTLMAYNVEMKKLDDLYRGAAKHCGMAECAFWILYTLRVEDSFWQSRSRRSTPRSKSLSRRAILRFHPAPTSAASSCG